MEPLQNLQCVSTQSALFGKDGKDRKTKDFQKLHAFILNNYDRIFTKTQFIVSFTANAQNICQFCIKNKGN